MDSFTTSQVMEALGCCASTARRIRESPGRLKMWQLEKLAEASNLQPEVLGEQILHAHVPSLCKTSNIC